jgi:hypothetical protein
VLAYSGWGIFPQTIRTLVVGDISYFWRNKLSRSHCSASTSSCTSSEGPWHVWWRAQRHKGFEA